MLMLATYLNVSEQNPPVYYTINMIIPGLHVTFYKATLVISSDKSLHRDPGPLGFCSILYQEGMK